MIRSLSAAVIILSVVGCAAGQPVQKIPKELAEYVATSRAIGLSEDQIRAGALKAGWPEAAVKQAIEPQQALNDAPAGGPEAIPPSLAAPSSPSPAETPATVPGRGVSDDYRIGEGDVISVSVWREAEASVPTAVVRPDGKVSLPLIKELYVAGMTPADAERAVTRQLSAFINKPEVAVVVKEIHSKKVYVVGAARKEGPLPYTYRMTVLQAISEAGGLTDYAKRKKIYVLRSQSGKQQKLPFNYDAAVKGERTEQNIELLPGDTLVIPN
jgi:polysaccharide export outer membrane protein